MKILGIPIGHEDFVNRMAEERLEKERTNLEYLPKLEDLQCAWLLLIYCAVPRANHLLRVVPPDLIRSYAEKHDNLIWRTFCKITGCLEWESYMKIREVASLPMRLGGLGLRSAVRTSIGAYFAA